MSMSCGFDASLLNSASKVEMKGFLDMGLLPALDGVFAEGEGMAGDAARLRNGLLEERLRERPGEGRRSGIDGSAIIVDGRSLNPAFTPNHSRRAHNLAGFQAPSGVEELLADKKNDARGARILLRARLQVGSR
jgi:hypothetical protein